jgi:hypothetical protein
VLNFYHLVDLADPEEVSSGGMPPPPQQQQPTLRR